MKVPLQAQVQCADDNFERLINVLKKLEVDKVTGLRKGNESKGVPGRSDAFISEDETPEHAAERVHTIAESTPNAVLLEDRMLMEEFLANDSLGG